MRLRMHIIVSLCRCDITGHRYCILLFLPPAHRLVIKFATLFLKLIIADVKSVSSETMIAHLIIKTVIICWILTENSLLLKTICRAIIVNIMWIVLWVGP